MTAKSVDELLAQARRRLERLGPLEAHAALSRGAVLVDIRSESQRARDGVVPGAHVVARNVLEWRADPASEWRDPPIADPSRQVIVMCDEGYQSSPAAATLQEPGIEPAADLSGGVQALR